MSQNKGKLHEVLAVESTLNKAAEKLMTESVKTLGKENLFLGQMRTLAMFEAKEEHLNTKETVELTTTVDENLDYIVGPVSDYYDAVLQKDRTNQIAVADLTVDGTTIGTNLPATFLLGLETKLGELRKVYDRIPTLAPGLNWAIDSDNEKAGVYKAEMPTAFKTENAVDFRIVVEPTQFHPAEIRELSKITNVGKYTTYRWCGMVTPLEKAMRIKRIDKLLLAVKKARQRANSAEVVSGNIGKDIFAYING